MYILCVQMALIHSDTVVLRKPNISVICQNSQTRTGTAESVSFSFPRMLLIFHGGTPERI